MDDSRYGRAPRWRGMALGLPPAISMFVVGCYWTLIAWGLVDEAADSRLLGAVGPILAGFGVALAYVCLRKRGT